MRRLAPIVVALLAAAPALAQEAPPPAAPAAPAAGPGQSPAAQRLMAADTNKDGKWSKDEWLAAGRREMGFMMLDANKDGFVTREELMEGMQRMRAMGMAPPQPN